MDKRENIDTLHSPKRAALLSAILPGTGQIYNNRYKPKDRKSRLWWKLPIVYGGIGASIYSTIINQREYKAFLDERTARLDPNYEFQYYPEYTSDQLFPVQEAYRKYRDYSIIAGLAVYALNIIDANVQGHLLHFDAGDDLSFNFIPNFSFRNSTSNFGAKLVLHIK